MNKNFRKINSQYEAITILYSEGKFDAAIREAQNLLKYFPTSMTLYNIIGAASGRLKNWEGAITAYETAIQINPKDHRIHNNAGVAYKNINKITEAIEAYKKAIEIKPDYADAHNNLAICLKIQGELAEALSIYKKLIEMQPQYNNVYVNIGMILENQEQIEQAIEAYKKSILASPHNVTAYKNLGVILKNRGDVTMAIEVLKKGIKYEPDCAEIHNNLGAAFKEQGNLTDARESFEFAIHLDPNYHIAQNNLGLVLEEIGQQDAAITSFKKALKIDPNNLDAIGNMLALPSHLITTDMMLVCEKALDRCLKNNISHPRITFIEAEIMKHKGELNDAFQKFSEANFLKKQKLGKMCSSEVMALNQVHDRLRHWNPVIRKAKNENLKKLFILGPSKSGKSTLEQLISGSDHLLPLYEYINLNFLNNRTSDNEKASIDFEKLFNQSEKSIIEKGYQCVCTTSPSTIHIVDQLFDELEETYFVIIERSLLDVAAEIFTQYYRQGHYYSYDPREIVRYLTTYNGIAQKLGAKIPSNCLTVNFNTIHSRPKEVLTSISHLLNIQFDTIELKRSDPSLRPRSTFRNYFEDALSTR